MANGWTYSDWDTSYTDGSSEQLSRLKLHIQEVADRLKQGSYSTEGKSHDFRYLTDYLKLLETRRDEIAGAVTAASGARVSFTRARLL